MKKVNLHIPKPCHQDWAQMTPAERGRFCAKCEKIVTDYTRWSQTQITEALRRGQLGCGRFRPDQLEQTYILSPADRNWRRAASLLFPLLLGGTSLAGQTVAPPPGIVVEQNIKQVDTKPSGEPSSQITIQGRVTDESGEALIGATVMIKGSRLGTVTDIDGTYSIVGPRKGTIIVSYLGYSNVEQAISSDIPQNEVVLQLDISILESDVMVLGGLSVISYQRNTLANVVRHWWRGRTWIRAERRAERIARREERSAPPPLNPVKWEETTTTPEKVFEVKAIAPFPQLRISPNPFEDHINIQFVFDRSETIQIQLLNSQGQLVSHRPYETQVGINQIDWVVNTNNLSAGVYFLQMVDANGRQQTESLLHTNQ